MAGPDITRPGTLATAAGHTLWMISVSAAAVNLGAARRALQAATASAQTKMHRFDTEPVIRQSPFIRAMAELEGQVELAVAGLRRLLDEVWHQASTGEQPTPVERAHLRLAAAHAVDTGSHVVRESIVARWRRCSAPIPPTRAVGPRHRDAPQPRGGQSVHP